MPGRRGRACGSGHAQGRTHRSHVPGMRRQGLMTLSNGLRGAAEGFPPTPAQVVAGALVVIAMFAAASPGPAASVRGSDAQPGAPASPSAAPVRFYIADAAGPVTRFGG